MSKVKTSDQLIAITKRRGMIPQSDKTFTTQEFLDVLNEEFSIGLLPKILELHEEHFVVTVDLEAVANTTPTRYKIPYRATGNKLRDVMVKNSSGLYREFSRIDPENKDMYYHYNAYVFYVEGDEIVLLSNDIQGTVQGSFYFRPNELVSDSRAGVITAIDTDTGEVTLSSTPTHFTTSIEYDFVKAKSPNKILTSDKTASVVNSTTNVITFTASDLPERLAVGDYLMQAEETIVPQMPVELIPVLTQMAAIACLDSMGDMEAVLKGEKKLEKMEKNLTILIDNRVEGAPQKVVNKKSRIGRYNSIRRHGFNN
jgi:hypothetical protein